MTVSPGVCGLPRAGDHHGHQSLPRVPLGLTPCGFLVKEGGTSEAGRDAEPLRAAARPQQPPASLSLAQGGVPVTLAWVLSSSNRAMTRASTETLPPRYSSR